MRDDRILFVSARSHHRLPAVHRTRGHRLRVHRIPPVASARVNDFVKSVHMRHIDMHNRLGEVLPGGWRVFPTRWYQPRYLNNYLFPWALQRMSERYESA